MRYLFVVFALVLFLSPSSAADEGPFSVSFVHEAEGTSEELFNGAKLWIAESFRSAKDVIDLADRDLGVVIGNGRIDLKIGWMTQTPAEFKMKIEVKDGRFRTTFSDVIMFFDAHGKPVEAANRDSLEPKLAVEFERLSNDLKAYIENSATTSDW